MTSKGRAQKGDLAPPGIKSSMPQDQVKLRRQATVYDAVAGRINSRGFISDSPFPPSTKDNSAASSSVLAPEEVLFKRRNAPERYEESDLYFASDSLAANALPDSDLLKALHCYASDFYCQTATDEGQGDYRSFDETALIAMGILLEESCREILGETGDMVFTEGEHQTESNISARSDELPIPDPTQGRTSEFRISGVKRQRMS